MRYISGSITALILTAFFVSGASAYIITISAPDSVFVGTPLVVIGSTTFPEDTYFDLVLYYSKYTAGEMKRQKVIVDKSKQFRSEFETRGLEKGQYKVEIHNIVSGGDSFVEKELGSASVTRRVVQLIDRSDEIVMDSLAEQNLSAALIVSGSLKNDKNGVVTMRVFGPEDFTYGPEQLITRAGLTDGDGHFSTHVPVSLPGEYMISFSDKKGYIGDYSLNVAGTPEEETAVVITPMPVETVIDTPVTTIPPTTAPTPSPTKSPLPAGIVLTGMILGYYLRRKQE